MRFNQLKSTLNTAVLAVTILLLGASTSFAQTVSLTAAPANALLPDGQQVPMWGYTCSAAAVAPATCAASNPNAVGNWSPVVITTTPGSNLTINLTNNLPAKVPETSLVIVGQLGAGLGTTASSAASPAHATQSATWPIAGDTSGPQYTPPPQASRVLSFSTPVANGGTTALVWNNLKAGTYLIESGTHPSIQGPMGLYGVLVVTTPATTTAGTAYPGVSYNAEIPFVFSEIDPVQNAAVTKAVSFADFSESTVWSGQPGKCGNPSSANFGDCYPPAVNYDPRYYLINGVSLDKTAVSKSLFATSPATATGAVLVRFVNAGLRMHVPSIVGATTGAAPSGGFALVAEDGNPLPGTPRIQSEVFLAAGKTYDVLINAPTSAAALPVFDRQLSLSTNNHRDGGMTAYIGVNGAVAPSGLASAAVVANADSYFCTAGVPLTVSDPAKGVIANDLNVLSVTLGTATGGTVVLNSDGTFTYTPAGASCGGSFSYFANGGLLTATATITDCATVTGCHGGPPVVTGTSYTSNIASRLQIAPPGVLAYATDPAGYPMTAALVTGSAAGGTVTLNADGSFTAIPTAPPATGATTMVSFQYNAVNSQKTSSTTPAAVTVTFNGGSGLQVHVYDAPSILPLQANGQPASSAIPITDYRWLIEEDRTFHIDPNATTTSLPCTSANVPAGCNPAYKPPPDLGTNFHTSYMPLVAAGCVGTAACETGQTLLGQPAVCDIGNGVCRTDAPQQVQVDPGQAYLDPAKHYYITIFPGDAGNSFSAGAGAPVQTGVDGQGNPVYRQFSIAQDCGSITGASTAANWAPGSGTCGHGMGGTTLAPGQLTVNVPLEETPYAPTKVAVFVFEDDWPLNGEEDAGGGVDTLAIHEPGLGGFEISLYDQAGGTGDATGLMTYDMFNFPLSNSLAGTPDPAHPGNDACPLTKNPDGLIGRVVTCPHFESDGMTASPLEGQAVIANMMPGRYGVEANVGADRLARGEEWLQTNTLDGQKAHDSFIKIAGPAYFQEFGPGGYHVLVGFANPAIINARRPGFCASEGVVCNNTVTGKVTTERMSRTPDQRLYSSGSRDSLSFTQCYASLGDPDGEDFAFTKCDADGNFTFQNMIPPGDWRITLFDQWNDQIVDGLSTPVRVPAGANGASVTVNMQNVPVQQWHTNIYTRSYFDTNGDGVSQDSEPGLTLLPTNIRFRDGSYSNFNNTDLNGFAGFNEVFPLFNWYVIEADTTRYKQTGVHVVYDAGGPADNTPGGGNSNIGANLANTQEQFPLPTNLRVPGAVYCADADCSADNLLTTPNGGGPGGSTGRIDPGSVTTEAWQGFIGMNEFVEFGKKPFNTGENGGIHGEVIYASTRPFDDPSLLIHTSWTPNVPNVTINLYQEGTGADGSTSLKLVDTTKTTSWDDFAQGSRSDGNPNMNCPGQDPSSMFFFSLTNSSELLNPTAVLPYNSRYKCYDGFAMFNQVQPAPYDGYYHFPSVTSTDPATGKPTGTNCTGCVPNSKAATTDFDYNQPMLPAGKYVVEVIVPPGYELVKEEDKNILIGDNYIAPVTQQFGGLGSIFILPDQAQVNSYYNANNAQNPTQSLGSVVYPRHEGDTGSVEAFWPCVGASRTVPDYISLFPQSKEVAPFAGATRNLCDRKEVTLEDQTAPLAKFWIFSSTHVAAHFTGIILDDFSSEFDPFSPQFGEKFAVPNVPVAFKDYTGVEVLRTYADQWGIFNGLQYSTWEVNPPNPTGYAPTMMVTCMNDPGPIVDTRAGSATLGQMITDPQYNPAYSQFCYEIPFMPGQTQYMDTPVVPTSAFAEGYNLPDCAYPDATPSVSEVDGDGIGPWVSGVGKTLTIKALGDQVVPNHGYSGPAASTAPFNQKFITRHYGFGTAQGTVTIGGVAAPITGWSDTTITVTAPSIPAANSSCKIQQRGVVGSALCGELVITAASGKQSVDTVTVTVGGKAPTRISGENGTNSAIQSAIDTATPGDLIMIGPGTYYEMLLMWKPVRLQGVAAASTIVNANTHPSGRIDPWRRQAACLFGLALDGGLVAPGHPYDPTNSFSCSAAMQGQVDPIPLEPLVGWDPTLNGNIAELLQEPTLLGAYEGAAITVLAKGVQSPDANCTANGVCVPLTNSTRDCNRWVGNFLCNPSRVDGISFLNSSEGGGGIFLHGWNHSIEVSNNRIHSNAGTLTGGITIGQSEVTDGTIAGTQELPYGYIKNANIHNNSVTNNTAYGDELNSTTPMAAGGVTFCTGSDNYRFNHNWVCGNLSTGDGGGFAHFGLSYNGNISNNWFLFNQSTNPSIPTHGGGVLVAGAPPDGPVCENAAVDIDCPPSLSDGAGPGLVIDSNLIVGNTAESGSGAGLRFQSVNGTEVVRNPHNPGNWYQVTVTNNIITNNVAGWDGGGVSLVDALRVSFINNTVMSNDSTASAGVLFNTLGAPDANTPPTGCDPTIDPTCSNSQVTSSTPQTAGLVVLPNTANLISALPAGGITCPPGQGNCATISNPILRNDLFWQNRAFNINVGGSGPGQLEQQHLVTLLPALTQPQADALTTVGGSSVITGGTGACVAGATYWDIGVRGDVSSTPGSSVPANTGFKLSPQYSILTNGTAYGPLSGSGNTHNLASNPLVAQQYCNGARTPPEDGGSGYAVPPGISDATLPNPVFNLTPSATVDEGNNWVNMAYGPLSLVNPAILSSDATNYNKPLGNYAITSSSPAIGAALGGVAPTQDFFGTPRPQARIGQGGFDIGAVEFVGTSAAPAVTLSGNGTFTTRTLPVSLASSQTLDLVLANAGPGTFTINTITFGGAPFSRVTGFAGSCGAVLPANLNVGSCTIRIRFRPTTAGTFTGSLAVTGTAPGGAADVVTGSPIALSGTALQAVVGFSAPSPVLTTTPATRTVKTGTITVTNSGNGPLTLTANPTVAKNSGPGAFAIVAPASGTQCVNGLVVAASGGTCTIGVSYTPPATGTLNNATGHVTLTDTGAANGTQNSAPNFSAN
jgi:hypothetical protein